MVHRLGQLALKIAASLGGYALFCGEALGAGFGTRKLFRRVVRATFEQGVLCLPVILIVGLFTGLVLGLQGYHTLTRFGSSGMLGALIALSLLRELGPVLAALMLVGQAGSSLAAELGIQRNSEQIAALETMGISSTGYLVAPRLLASIFVFPAQTALFVVVGLWGGSLSGSALLGVEPGVYWSSVERAVELADVRDGLLKAMAFGILTMNLCAYQGFHADRLPNLSGARAVSVATTLAVVQSSILILAVDYIITSLLV